jgi:hypothetical protein
MSNVIAFPDPTERPLKGASREVAIQAFRTGLATIVPKAIRAP